MLGFQFHFVMRKHILPLGFRFHPTDVELLKYYLKRKLLGKKFSFEAIAEVDIYKYAPWDLPDLSCLKSGDLKWFFFCPIGKKYARGGRLNRATVHGYWKSTGKDKAVKYNEEVVGMIRTLVFHQGKSPCGDRTDWVMHEYRLKEKELTDRGVVQDSYVLCVVFQKDGIGSKNGAQYGAPFKEEEWSDNEDSNLVETGFLSCVSKLSSGGASSSYVAQSLCAEPYVDSSGRHTPVPQMTINSTVGILSDIDSNAQSLVANTDTNGATTFVDALDHPIVVPAVMKVPQIELDSSALPLMVTTDTTNGASTCVDAPSHPLVVNDPNVVSAAIEAPQLAQVQESSDNILSMLDFFTEEDIIDSGLMTGDSNPSKFESPQFSSDDDISAMLAFFIEDHVNTLF